MYLIVGWNKIVESLARTFEFRGSEFKIFAEDIQRSVDIYPLEKLYDHIDRNCIVYLLQSNIDKRVKVSKKIRELCIDCKLISIGSEDEIRELRDQKIDKIVRKEELISATLIKYIDDLEQENKSQRLVEIIKGSEKEISIFLHNNPDPDAFASAMALENICEEYDKNYNTYYGGTIGHPENQIIIETTGIKMTKVEEKDIGPILQKSDTIVFLDFAEAGSNNILPEDTNADIIIDHHRTSKDIKRANYNEIRTDVGATSTIMTKHLLNLGIEISSILASCLLYGIKVDTDDYTKNIFVTDFKIISFLSAVADKDLLDIFESPPINPDTISALGKAIVNRKFKNGSLLAYTGKISEKDDIPQIANILMRERDIDTVLVYGILNDKIFMSARSKDIKLDIGDRMKKAFSNLGTAGGHQHAAGGKIELSKFDDLDKALNKIEEIFSKEVVHN